MGFGAGGGGSGWDASGLARLLAPTLVAATDGRLSEIEWFQSTWQAGGAATGFSTYRFDDGDAIDVVVKLPVGPAEYRWTVGLGLCSSSAWCCPVGPTPSVVAAGTELGGYDLAWLVVERLKGSTLNKDLCGDGIEDLLYSAAEWYERAQRLWPIQQALVAQSSYIRPKREDWPRLLAKARHAVAEGALIEEERWAGLLKRVERHLDALVSRWEARPINTWCHGDLHPGNAMRRHPSSPTPETKTNTPGLDNKPARSPIVLIDLALVHPGHWVEDAVYLERLFWGRSERLDGVKIVPTLARHCRERGIRAGEDYTELANIRRVLMAATVPAFIAGEGHPKYVSAAAEVLERVLPIVTG